MHAALCGCKSETGGTASTFSRPKWVPNSQVLKYSAHDVPWASDMAYEGLVHPCGEACHWMKKLACIHAQSCVIMHNHAQQIHQPSNTLATSPFQLLLEVGRASTSSKKISMHVGQAPAQHRKDTAASLNQVQESGPISCWEWSLGFLLNNFQDRAAHHAARALCPSLGSKPFGKAVAEKKHRITNRKHVQHILCVSWQESVMLWQCWTNPLASVAGIHLLPLTLTARK